MLDPRKALAALAVAFLLPLQTQAADAPPSGARGDLLFESGDFMKNTFYVDSARIATDASEDGAYSKVNQAWDKSRSGSWYIEQQRYGEDAVAAGIAQSDAAAIERGLNILEWGFRQERVDGSFDCPDAFHSTSFFVEAAAHAALLLDASPYRTAYGKRLEGWKPKLRAAAAWMTRPDIEKKGKAHNRPYTHRFYLVAAALGETGVWLADPALVEKSKTYILEGLARQGPSGFNPEKGGYDGSYHTVGLLFATRYFMIVADPALRRAMTPMLDKAFRWFKTRVNPQGIISSEGNTRTGLGQEAGRDGKPKKLSYNSAYRASAYQSLNTGDASYEDLAWKLFRAEKNLR